jgi:hypothetical protein
MLGLLMNIELASTWKVVVVVWFSVQSLNLPACIEGTTVDVHLMCRPLLKLRTFTKTRTDHSFATCYNAVSVF